MTDTLNAELPDLTEHEIEPSLNAIDLTPAQKRAAVIFIAAAAVIVVTTLALTIQASNTVNTLTHTFWVHLMSK